MAAVGIGMLLQACTVIHQEVGQALHVDHSSLSEATHYSEVLDLLGPPHKISRTSSGMVFAYEEVDLTERQLGVNLTIKDVTLLKVVVAREYADRQALMIVFDEGGDLKSYGHDEWSDIVAEGGAFQFIFVIASVADEGTLNDSPIVHDWGMGLLEANHSHSLNRQSNLDTGQSGIEQIGTPTAVGQRTLELR